MPPQHAVPSWQSISHSKQTWTGCHHLGRTAVILAPLAGKAGEQHLTRTTAWVQLVACSPYSDSLLLCEPCHCPRHQFYAYHP